MEFDSLSKKVIGFAIEVHRELGPGLLESTYERCLTHELREHDIECATQMALPVEYDAQGGASVAGGRTPEATKGLSLDCGYRVDLIVEDRLIVELKSVDSLQRIHEAQLLTYMKLAHVGIGLLINFNTRLLKSGIKRFVL